MGSNFASIHIFDPSLSVDQRAFSEDYLNKLHDVNLEYQKESKCIATILLFSAFVQKIT